MVAHGLVELTMSLLNFTHVGETAIPGDDLPLLDLFRAKSEWVWTKELTTAPDSRANEQRAFRKTFINTLAPKVRPVNATIIIAVDNYYALYVNGALLHAADPKNDYRNALVYNIPVYHDTLVFAIRAINANDDGGLENPAGVKAAIKIAYSDGSPSTMYYSGQDQTFLSQNLFGEGWEKPDFNDEGWTPAAVQNGQAFRGLWNALVVPTKAIQATIDASAFARAQGAAGGKTFKSGEVAGLAVGMFTLGALVAAVVTYFISRKRFLNKPVAPTIPQPEIQPAAMHVNQYLMATPLDYSPPGSKVQPTIQNHMHIHGPPTLTPEYR